MIQFILGWFLLKWVFKGFLILLLFIFIGILFSMVYATEVKNIENGIIIQTHVTTNNLTMPFPDYVSYYPNSELDIMTQDFKTFQNTLKNSYAYDDLYNCKYWSLVWVNYWKYNKDKYNWDLQIINTDNHVFVIVSNKTSYCILDQDIVNCVNISGNY